MSWLTLSVDFACLEMICDRASGMRCGWVEVVMTSDVRTAFTGVDLVVMLAKLDRKANDDHREYLKSIVTISRQHGAAIDKYAKKTVKVVQLFIAATTTGLANVTIRHVFWCCGSSPF